MSINQINSGSLNLDFTIQGIASYFNIIDFQGDQINSNALFANSMPLMLLEHDWQKIIGTWHSLEMNEQNLFAHGTLDSTNEFGNQAIDMIRHAQLGGLSIGYVCHDFDMCDGIRIIKRAEIVEISLVKQPANQHALIDSLTATFYKTNI